MSYTGHKFKSWESCESLSSQLSLKATLGHIKSMQYSAYQLLTRSCRFHSSSLQTGSVLKLKYYMYIFYLNTLWNNSEKITLQRMQVLWENNGNISLNQWKHCWRNLFLWKLGNHITAAAMATWLSKAIVQFTHWLNWPTIHHLEEDRSIVLYKYCHC